MVFLNQYIDHTLLRPDANHEAIDQLCKEALHYEFAAVCVAPCWVDRVVALCRGSSVKVCSVAGFPLGSTLERVKVEETKCLIDKGVQEVDTVINIGFLKAGYFDRIGEEIASIVSIAQGAVVKVILETCLLSEEEKIRACELAKKAGAHFVKTSTGFSRSGATVEDIKLLRKTVGLEMGVKASGGIRDLETALLMIEAGASRIGTSAGVSLIENFCRAQ
jgi:deoxyribose-phosphate aldolase